MSLRIRILVAIALVALLGIGGFFGWRAQRQRSARQILSRVAQVYAGCSSYQDSGTVQLKFKQQVIARLDFTTSFVRPDRFRFESSFKNRSPEATENRCIVWRTGPQFAFWGSLFPKMEPPSSFDMAIAAGSGASMSTARIIPALLHSEKEIKGRRITEMEDATQLGDAISEGVNCFRIQGRHANLSAVLWIGKDDYLIRRIERTSDPSGKSTMNYRPIVDGNIPDGALEWNAPQ